MEKEFIPYAEALALKELGFDEPCFAFYKDNKLSGCKYPDEDSQFDLCTNTQMKEYKNSDKYCSAPTYQQAFRWFREKYGLDSFVKHLYKSTIKVGYYFGIDEYKGIEFQMNLDDYYKIYEEAELECLKKLIEIVKNK